MLADEKERQHHTEEEARDVQVLEDGEKRREALQEKIENILMAEEMRNEDLTDLSSSL